jgi:hypothetical protein
MSQKKKVRKLASISCLCGICGIFAYQIAFCQGNETKRVKLDDSKLVELRLQQQRQAKVDLRQRLEEENRNSKINNLKILNQWRKIMRLAKAESLKKDVEILSQNHERDVDRKDAILQMLDRSEVTN